MFQSRVLKYKDFLQKRFDGTANNISPLAQIYMITQANKERSGRLNGNFILTGHSINARKTIAATVANKNGE